MSKIRFFVPGMPKTAGSKRVFMNPHTKQPIITDDCAKSKDWRASVQYGAIEVMRECRILDEALDVTFEFILPRPKSHFGAKGVRPGANPYPITKPDLLKLARAAEDALTGIIWRDDSRIVNEHLFKRYNNEGRAGCWITVRPMDGREEINVSENPLSGPIDGESIVRQMGMRFL